MRKVWSAGDQLTASDLNGNFQFGGTGADGALSISSGTTTINCSSAAYVEKNYSSISITGTAALAFSNPNSNGTIIALKSTGNVTITSTAARAIDLRNMGGGAGNAPLSAIQANNGPLGGAGGGGCTGPGTGGGVIFAAGNITALILPGPTLPYPNPHTRFVAPGGNGNAGAQGGASAGSGGTGAGALYIECAGPYNFGASSTIDASGGAGGNGTNGGGALGGSGGGGGGGGAILVLYGSLTADSGTYSVAGGGGGSGGTGTPGGSGGGSGGNGSALRLINTFFA